MAQGQDLVPDQPESGEREPLPSRLPPRGGGHGEEEVAQLPVGHLAAGCGVERAVLDEQEGPRDAEGKEVGRPGAWAGFEGTRTRTAGILLQLAGQRGATDLVPAEGDLEGGGGAWL